MSKLIPIQGKIQHYAWGGTEFIPNLLNLENAVGRYAEYWLGAHQNSPSTLIGSGKYEELSTFIQTNLQVALGESIARKFGRLPFLFKVLDVHDMLSIQVHPSKTEAEKGFAKENKLGISQTAPHRNYKDDNHKPEIMVALGEFWLLHGFLPKGQLLTILESTPELTYLREVFVQHGYQGLYKSVMEQSDNERNATLQPLIERIMPLYQKGGLKKTSPDYWAAQAVSTLANPSTLDRGIYSIYFFNIVRLESGQAIFQDAGIPHAYLEGQNIELMANSDNVLRGGLTPKHVDVPELLKHIIFKPTHPSIIDGQLAADGLERIYESPAPDFELSSIALESKVTYSTHTNTGEILLVVEGEMTITEGNQTYSLNKGEALFICADTSYQLHSSASALVFKATTPT